MEMLADFWRVSFVVLLGFSGACGLLALASPKAFAAVATYGSRVVNKGGKTKADRWINIDRYVFKYARFFGLALIVSVGYLWIMSQHGPENYSKPFLLIIVGISMTMGIVAISHIVKQKRQIESHLAEAHTDALTGLANRRAFDSELSRRVAQRQRQGTPLSLMIIDIDKFKTFNDSFGHLLGDAIIKEVARALSTTARHMDFVARMGGDEFAVVLVGSNLDDSSDAAERFRAAIGDKPLDYEGNEHTLTVSIGLAEAQADDDMRSLFKRADSALYSAKEAGRNCCYRDAGPEPAVCTSTES